MKKFRICQVAGLLAIGAQLLFPTLAVADDDDFCVVTTTHAPNGYYIETHDCPLYPNNRTTGPVKRFVVQPDSSVMIRDDKGNQSKLIYVCTDKEAGKKGKWKLKKLNTKYYGYQCVK